MRVGLARVAKVINLTGLKRYRTTAGLPRGRLRLSLSFELRQPCERFDAVRPTHLGLRLQTRTARRPLRPAEDRAAQVVAELHAAHACRLAIRHARNGARNRRRDTARAAIGAARMIGHVKWRLALNDAVRHFYLRTLLHAFPHITHDTLPDPENGQRITRPALCHCIPCDLFTQSGLGSLP
jgi:hypothetical protein